MNRRKFLTAIAALAIVPKIVPKIKSKVMLYCNPYISSAPVGRMSNIPGITPREYFWEYTYPRHLRTSNDSDILILMEQRMKKETEDMLRNVNRNLFYRD